MHDTKPTLRGPRVRPPTRRATRVDHPHARPALTKARRPDEDLDRRPGHRAALAPPSGPFSILFGPGSDGSVVATVQRPACFTDLHLDHLVDSVTSGREEYELEPFFWLTLHDPRAVGYRHEVFDDLEDAGLEEAVRTFASGMRTMRERLARESKAHYRYEKECWFLDAVAAYVEAVSRLREDLGRLEPHSAGFRALRDFTTSYVDGVAFTRLAADTRRVGAALDDVRYRLDIAGPRVTVGPYSGERDYGEEVMWTFDRFKRRGVEGPTFSFRTTPTMNHVEARILDLVARLHPAAFAALDELCDRHRAYLDETIARFDREVQFYLAYREHMQRFASAGLAFCYPQVSVRSKVLRVTDTYDLALAEVLVGERRPVVTNDLRLDDPERILVVSGPNQGGKTTFARTVGQLHHLAGLGLPVPGTKARLFLVDRIFTHFDRIEQLEELTGKLEDDLRRIRRILESATPDSLVILNESFASTSRRDALFLNRRVLASLVERDVICVTVTFLDELAAGPTTVSLVSQVDPEEPAWRTFKILRRPADGLAYAMAIAEKHRLTYDMVKRRLQP